MQDLLSNPFLLVALGVVIGGTIGFIGAQYKFSSPPVDPSCSGDYALAKAKIISLSRAKEMYASYTEKRARLIENAEGDHFETTRFGSIKLAILRNYVDYLICIDKRMRNQGLSGIQSVRTYFAHYPSEFKNGDSMLSAMHRGTNYSYSGRNTFFMLPTMLNEDQEEKGFKIVGEGNAPSFQTIEDFLKTTTDEKERHSEVGSLILNEVALTPPPPGQQGDFSG